MLFSEPTTAKYINTHFEPVWESVRDVPRFTLDFGKGCVVHRTLNGNIATYVCTADGTVLDVMPGLYSPSKYQVTLEQFSRLATYVQPDGRFSEGRLLSYHKQLASQLSSGKEPARLEKTRNSIVIVSSSNRLPKTPNPSDLILENPNIKSPAEVNHWQALIAETKYNEAVRRKAIHQFLTTKTEKKDMRITKWIYKTVLHADLDDPYLGLGPTLFATYPFQH